MTSPIEAVIYGDNGDLIKQVVSLHGKPTDQIADLTYGKGVFWRKVDDDVRRRVTGSDIITVSNRPYDFRDTPYGDGDFDIAVLDPPYIHSPGNHLTDSRYQNAATTKGMLHHDIRQLYMDGMREAARIAKRQVWVKCKDQVQSGMQRWAHCEMLADALSIGLFARDLFILIPKSKTSRGRWDVQHHARKPHSYLWVLEKPSRKNESQIKREGLFLTMNPIKPSES